MSKEISHEELIRESPAFWDIDEPIRIHILDVFVDLENGNPNAITKAGCLALAKKGCRVWNAWRKSFPQSFHNDNLIDFSDHDFSTENMAFWGYDFGDFANFSRAIFPPNFLFSKSIFGKSCSFVGARFGHSVNFDEAIFSAGSDFRCAQFGINASFFRVNFKENTLFLGAIFGPNTQFLEVKFDGLVSFVALSWEQVKIIAELNEENFLCTKKYSSSFNGAPDCFHQIDFSGAQFLGKPADNGETSVDFSGRKFLGKTLFSKINSDSCPVIFRSIPKFHECEIYPDTRIIDAIFPEPTGSEDAIGAYRTLKQSFSKKQAIREEQHFFRLEMEEEMLRQTGLKRCLFRVYKELSDYGFSITLPLKYGILSVLGLTAVYGLISVAGQCTFSGHACHFAPEWLQFSLLQTLPLPGLDKLSETARDAFWPKGAWWHLALLALVIVHKTISLAMLFLIGLALRNLFKLK